MHQWCLQVFAKATADAFIASDCWDSKAKTDIEADTGADYYTLEGCEPAEVEATKGSQTLAMGMGVRPLLCTRPCPALLMRSCELKPDRSTGYPCTPSMTASHAPA